MRWDSFQKSLVFAFCLLLLDLSLAFYQLKVPGWIVQLLAALHASPSPTSRGVFYCGRRVGPLGLSWEALFSLLGKLWVCSLCPCTTCLSQLISNNVWFLVN